MRGWSLVLVAFAIGCGGERAALHELVEADVAGAEATGQRLEIPGGAREDERWSAEAALPRWHRYDREEVSALEAYAARCGEPPEATSAALRKAWTWARHRCGAGPLPPGFFEEAPFMHPDGRSFAWHARACGPACTGARGVDGRGAPGSLVDGRGAPGSLVDAFHVLERREIDPAWPRLDRRALAAFRSGAAFVNVGETLWLRTPGAYLGVRPRAIAAADGRIAIGDGVTCADRSFDRCWVDARDLGAARLTRGLGIAIAGVVVALVLVFAGLRVRLRRKVATERAFVLRLLAHELRTPVTALKLRVEAARAGFDEMPDAAQDAFLGVARDVARLERIVQASAVYLRGDARQSEAARPVASLNELVSAIVAEATDEDVTIEAPEVPVSIATTSLALALRNLVRNAVTHGAAPFVVRATVDARGVSIEVADAGDFPEAARRALGTAFTKTDGRGGLGLGLYLARQVVLSSGGRLAITRAPTRATMWMPRAQEEEKG